MFQSIIGALATSLDTASVMIFAMSLGFSTMPMAFGFFAAAVGLFVFRQVSPLSALSEAIVLVSKITDDKRERATIGTFTGIVMVILGLTGAANGIVSFIGDTILYAMMAGVGIMIVKVGLDMVSDDKLVSLVSIGGGAVTYFLTQNIIYTVVASVAAATLIYNVYNREEIHSLPPADLSNEKLKFIKPVFSKKVIRGVLALSTLLLGSVIAEGTLTAQLGGWTANADHMVIYTGVADILSSIFGGAPLGMIVAGTSMTPNPMLSGIFMMIFIGILALFKIIPRLGKYIPAQAASGILFNVGMFVVIPSNAQTALNGGSLVATVTMIVTAFVDPFFGMCAGVAVRFITGFLGM